MNVDRSGSYPAPDRQRDYEEVVVNLALWSAAGDALGWMTEMFHGNSGVRYRTGAGKVSKPITWRRRIGGQSGVTVELPAGTYSDDTQLRLSVSRAIRGDGKFDVEAFAKIEITVWQGYFLGAGIGSKAAASNLSKRSVNWFSNFFNIEKQQYTNAGGNGAAMRIQPHVWSARESGREMVKGVLHDSLVTHGHPHGFCGAVFHAKCLQSTIQNRRIPTLEDAQAFVEQMPQLEDLIRHDNELSLFWLPTWKRETNTELADALEMFRVEAVRDLDAVDRLFQFNNPPPPPPKKYHDLLRELGCLEKQFRGSGFKTSLAALLLSQLYENGNYSATKCCSDVGFLWTSGGRVRASYSIYWT